MSGSITSLGIPKSLSPEVEARKERAKQDNETLRQAFSRNQLRLDNIDWVVTGFLIAVHVGSLAAFLPQFFTWQGIAICVGLHWLTCSIGVCLGYHRFLAHKSMKLRAPAEFFVLLAGCLSGEGSPMTWAATHRLHHQKSDQDGDPHSPLVGAWWSHLLWLFVKRKPEDQSLLWRKYIPELVDRPLMKFFESTFAMWLWVQGIALLGIGWAMGGWTMGVSFLVWGMCVRMTAAYHTTWLINSATHLWGYRNYDTRDESRNLWWVAILAYGEGWHNNHHAHPSLAPAGHRWWEIDMTWWAIRALQMTGLAYDVRNTMPSGRKANDAPVEEASASAVTNEFAA
ncbi:MAG: fatty acid desaturase [Planctomycetaceae bacterium]|nr:fatty acid desaturase [Planctomycetaceae bacterium]